MSFQVKNGKFFILDILGDNRESTVFAEKAQAISKVVEMLSKEKELTEELAKKYSLQQVTIEDDKYEIIPLGWFEILSIFIKEKRQ